MTRLTNLPERQAAEQTVERLRSEGWDVVAEPGPDQLPESLAEFRPDLLAHRGQEHALVEIRSRRLPPNLDMVTLAERVAELPGWRLDLVYVPDMPIADQDELMRWTETAAGLAQSAPEAALLLGWAAAEGILHRLAQPKGVDTDAPGRLLATLASLGIVGHDQHDVLRRALEARNALAHGHRVEPVTRELVQDLVAQARALAAGVGADGPSAQGLPGR